MGPCWSLGSCTALQQLSGAHMRVASRVGYCATRGRLGVGRLACPRVACLSSTDLASYHLRLLRFDSHSLQLTVPNRVESGQRPAGTPPPCTHSTRTVKFGLGFKLGKLTRSYWIRRYVAVSAHESATFQTWHHI